MSSKKRRNKRERKRADFLSAQSAMLTTQRVMLESLNGIQQHLIELTRQVQSLRDARDDDPADWWKSGPATDESEN